MNAGRLRELFAATCDLEPTARDGFLAASCAGRPELRAAHEPLDEALEAGGLHRAHPSALRCRRERSLGQVGGGAADIARCEPVKSAGLSLRVARKLGAGPVATADLLSAAPVCFPLAP